MLSEWRSRVYEALDAWSHRGGVGTPRGWLKRRVCDAWDWHVTGGELGRSLVLGRRPKPEPERFVGATAGEPPTVGTFKAGDWVQTPDGTAFRCVKAGSPGRWERFEFGEEDDG